MARDSLLERIVKERVSQAFVGTVSVTVDRIAEEIAREALADDTFRRTLRELVRRRSQDLLEKLLQDGARNGQRARRAKRSRHAR